MRIGIVSALLLTATATVAAQETTGDVRGRLLSPTGAPVRGATITAASQSLPGIRSARSATDGVYRILALPPGIYSLTVRQPGFRPAVIDSVHVQLGRATGLPDLTLETAAVELSQQRIEAPRSTLDPTRTTIGATLSATDYATLPAERDYKALMTVLPHVNTSYHGDGVNVGGSTGLENAYFIDGVNVTSPLNGVAGTGLPYNFIRTVEVRSGGYEAQFGKALGAIVNAVTYTGTNEFEANVFGFMTHDALAMSPRLPPTLRTTRSYTYDVGARVSGPMIRDRLWFSAAYNPRVEHADRVIGTLGSFAEERTAHIFAGKFTWQPRPAMTAEVSIFGDPTRANVVTIEDFFSALIPLTADSYLQRVTTGGVSASAKVTRTMGTFGLVEAAVSRSTFRDNVLPATSAGLEPLLVDFEENTLQGGLPSTTSNEQLRLAMAVRASLALGRHTLVSGAEYEDNRDRNTFDNPGIGVIIRTGPSEYMTIDQHVNDRVRSRVPTLYVQDSWRANDRLTLNAGLRFSGQWLEDGSGTTAQRFPDEWQPRVGFNWQPGDTRAQRFFGSYGRFFLQEPLNLATLYYVNYSGWQRFYTSDPRNAGATPFDSVGGASSGADFPPVDDVEVENFDEFTLGYERLFGGSTRATVRVLHRELRSSFQQGIDTTGRFLLGTPGKGDLAFLPSPVRNHTALEVSVEGGLSRLRYRASYVLSRSRGNFTGLYSSDTYSANPGNNQGLAAFYQANGSYGRLPNDIPHVFKLVAMYRPVSTLSLGAFFTSMSGTPLNRFGAGPMGFFRFLAPRGSQGRIESTWDLNTRLAWDRTVAGTAARFILDLQHVGNPRAATRVDQTLYRSEDRYGNQASRNPRFLAPIAFQPPMTARVGIEFSR